MSNRCLVKSILFLFLYGFFAASWATAAQDGGAFPKCERKDLKVYYQPIIHQSKRLFGSGTKTIEYPKSQIQLLQATPGQGCVISFHHLGWQIENIGFGGGGDIRRMRRSEKRELDRLFRHFLLPHHQQEDTKYVGKRNLESGAAVIITEDSPPGEILYPLYPLKPSLSKPITFDLVIDVSGSSPFFIGVNEYTRGKKVIEAITSLYNGIKELAGPDDTVHIRFMGGGIKEISGETPLEGLDFKTFRKHQAEAEKDSTSFSTLLKGLSSAYLDRHHVIIVVTDGCPDEKGKNPFCKKDPRKPYRNIASVLDKRTEQFNSSYHLFMVMTSRRSTKPEPAKVVQKRARKMRQELMGETRPVDVLSIGAEKTPAGKAPLFETDTLARTARAIMERVGRGERVVISKSWPDNHLHTLQVTVEGHSRRSNRDNITKLQQINLAFRPMEARPRLTEDIVAPIRAPGKEDILTMETEEFLLKNRGKTARSIPLKDDDRKKLMESHGLVHAIHTAGIKGVNLNEYSFDTLATRVGHYTPQSCSAPFGGGNEKKADCRSIPVFDIPLFYLHDDIAVSMERKFTPGPLWLLWEILPRHPVIGKEEIRVNIDHTEKELYEIDIEAIKTEEANIRLTQPGWPGVSIDDCAKCRSHAPMAHRKTVCKCIAIQPPFPTQLHGHLELPMVFKTEIGTQPVLANMVREISDGEWYKFDGNHLRVPLNNKYYEDTRENIWVYVVLFLCYLFFILVLVKRGLLRLHQKPHAIRGLDAVAVPRAGAGAGSPAINPPFGINDYGHRYYLWHRRDKTIIVSRKKLETLWTFENEAGREGLHPLELADLKYLTEHSKELDFCVQDAGNEEHYKLAWKKDKRPLGAGFRFENNGKERCREAFRSGDLGLSRNSYLATLFNPRYPITFLLLLPWMLLRFVACLAGFVLDRLVHHPNHYHSRFEKDDKSSAWDRVSPFILPMFPFAYILWFWVLYDGERFWSSIGWLIPIWVGFIAIFSVVIRPRYTKLFQPLTWILLIFGLLMIAMVLLDGENTMGIVSFVFRAIF
uniref:VWFA domain-containing protein n=1 Tax=Candidatus Kentrum sp. MB TaxID=2138164 RepID=A0A450X079_9GAMM|nr:MAG: hypothetical protein BECKMB1821G_GA0114241_100289 [Candidatus Kentron sp. MB]